METETAIVPGLRQPRFCVKRGRIDWSASPNAEPFEVPSGERPWAGRVLTPGALRAVVQAHARAKRNDPRGRFADLRGVGLDREGRRLIDQKLGDLETRGLWGEVILTALGELAEIAKTALAKG